uniref:tRNA-Ile lysidine synthase n=1 Tax=Tetraselmis marina TaxID=41888 RepID=UPI0021AD3580|nr:tRNA-Ile lysidine synthase [Tetraselmis marina]UUA64551.1 tRNA-Ile lysidine synthase [Tetraselmis marina]
MMKQFLRICSKQFKDKVLLLPNSRTLLAVSGGQDSLNLFYILNSLKKQWQLSNKCIYCVHLWQFESLQTYYHLMFTHFAMECSLYVATPVYLESALTETKARVWRYSVFHRLAFLENNRCILTGHTRTDQLESFFLNLTSGTGSYGSIALTSDRQTYQPKFLCFSETRQTFNSWDASENRLVLTNQLNQYYLEIPPNFFRRFHLNNFMQIYRPILFLNRYEVSLVMQVLKLPIWTDKTNFQFECIRNRVRVQLLPTLRFYFNPKIDVALARHLKIWSRETYFLDKLLITFISHNNLCHFSKKLIILDTSLFTTMPYFLQKRFIIYFLKLLCNKRFSNSDIKQTFKTIFLAMKLTRYQIKPQIFFISKELFVTSLKNKLYFSV